MQYSTVTFGNQESLTALIDGQLYAATDAHPAYEQIRERVLAGDESVASLFDLAEAVRTVFGEVTDRVTVEEDRVLLDGEEVSGKVSEALISLVGTDGLDGAIGLARFLERLSENPSFRSREQLFTFINLHGINIDSDGYLMFHKGVRSDDKGGYESVNSGTAFVNGEKVVGRIPAKVGDVIAMPRAEVSDDPTVACHAGLHVATRDYAQGYGRHGAILTMRVDPADVVAVPVDSGTQKLRVCRYEVVEVNTREFNDSLWRSESEYDEDEDEYWDDEDEYILDEPEDTDTANSRWSGATTVAGHTAYVQSQDDEQGEEDPRTYNVWS